MNWNNIWVAVKNYVGVGLDTVKSVEVTPPDAPDLHDIVAKKEKSKKPRKTTKKSP